MQMLLVLDTCGTNGYVGVVDIAKPDQSVTERVLPARASQEELLPAVQTVLREAEVALPDLTAVAVVAGPGSFTGVRIGMATAKGLSEAAGVPLVTLSRLAVLAHAAEERPAFAWLQAGRGDVYAARFAPGEEAAGELLGLPVAAEQAGSGTVLVCEEELRHAAPATQWVDSPRFLRALRSLAVDAAKRQAWADVALSDALYLRIPDAELALKARQA